VASVTVVCMPAMQTGTHPARTFWWDRARPVDAAVHPLRAVILDLDGAVADIERDGNRVAFNAAFAAHGLDIEWDVEQYGRLLKISDERCRIAVELCRRGFGKSANFLADEVYSTKTEWFDDCVLDGVVEPRPGVIDLVMSSFVAGIWVGVVSNGRRQLVEPLVRQLVGDGVVETIVTGDDVSEPKRDVELYALALWELGIPPQSALAVTGSAKGVRAATAVGVPTVVVTTDCTADQEFLGATAVLGGYDDVDPLGDCRRLHRRWCLTNQRAA
jgi:beta-phosphoglucomutase-like phosphatase (HAD superfamily)